MKEIAKFFSDSFMFSATVILCETSSTRMSYMRASRAKERLVSLETPSPCPINHEMKSKRSRSLTSKNRMTGLMLKVMMSGCISPLALSKIVYIF